MSGGGNKVQCCKEQYCIRTWNVRSKNQGKLEVVKQKMIRVNIDILGISELEWAEISELNSHDHYINYWGQESDRINGVALIVNKRVQNAVLGYDLKNSKMISIRLQVKPFNIIVIQVCAPTTNAKDAEVEQFYEDLQDFPVQFCSVSQSSLTLCEPMDHSTQGFPVHHQLLEFTQTYVHLTWWCHPTISFSVIPFSYCLQSFPGSGSFQMNHFLASVGQSIRVSASA